MDGNTVAAIVGTAVGVAGSVVGTVVGLRSAKSSGERRYLIKWVIAFCVLIGGFLVAFWLAPAAYRTWIWILYALMLPAAIIASNRGHARFYKDRRSNAA
jgi:hypothetical protein